MVKTKTLYTCLYISNKCVNNCPYCGYKITNQLNRITLTPEEIRAEAKVIKSQGINNAILIGSTSIDYNGLVLAAAKIMIEEGLNPWIEFENLSIETLKELKMIGADCFVLFQETYDKELYAELHKDSPYKGSYEARLRKVDEAVEAGFKNIGIGALLGLNKDYLTEIIGLMKHARFLMEKGVSVTIHLPRLTPAMNVSMKSLINEEEFEKIVHLLRLALPRVTFALTARERKELRNRLFDIIDYIGCGGVPNPGGRTTYKKEYEKGDKQFALYDSRTPEEIKDYLVHAKFFECL